MTKKIEDGGPAFPLPLIPCRGQLGFFNLEPDTYRSVADAIRALQQKGSSNA